MTFHTSQVGTDFKENFAIVAFAPPHSRWLLNNGRWLQMREKYQTGTNRGIVTTIPNSFFNLGKIKLRRHMHIAQSSGPDSWSTAEEEEKDYRIADLIGQRLFVTGLAATVDDARLYLEFESIGGLLEARVVKPG